MFKKEPPRYPWKDPAVLICELGHGDRRIAGQGTLYAMVHRLMIVKEEARARYTITLPDRQVAPFAFSADEFPELIIEHQRARL
ncbi:hypothetical protein DMC47_35230 [Nostoc sp. 3335mG]|nr:hypothetical protein DMC47_35230 [Nostoc sp. 3335mG]